MADLIPRLAALAVDFGANLQRGQILGVGAELGQEELVRAIAEHAYRRGARFVDVAYFDPHVKRSRILHAPDETLDFVPSWLGRRWLALGEERAAYVAVTGSTAPGLLGDLDPARAGRDLLPSVREALTVVNERTVNWTIVPCATPAWARAVRPELPEREAYDRLWGDLGRVLRLDEDDPVAAWNARIETTAAAAERLTAGRFDALRFRGPGTDLVVGLLPSSSWWSARFSTAEGLVHHPNLPSEEVFTTPDPARTEGVVTATKPLVFTDGTAVRGLRVTFEGGRAVGIDADEGAENLRARCAVDDGGSRLGEVALVDGEGRVGPLGTVFLDTLLDENAASHIALGTGYEFAVGAEEDLARVNRSAVHVDFMIGGDDVEVTGLTEAGDEVPVLRRGSWQV